MDFLSARGRFFVFRGMMKRLSAIIILIALFVAVPQPPAQAQGCGLQVWGTDNYLSVTYNLANYTGVPQYITAVTYTWGEINGSLTQLHTYFPGGGGDTILWSGNQGPGQISLDTNIVVEPNGDMSLFLAAIHSVSPGEGASTLQIICSPTPPPTATPTVTPTPEPTPTATPVSGCGLTASHTEQTSAGENYFSIINNTGSAQRLTSYTYDFSYSTAYDLSQIGYLTAAILYSVDAPDPPQNVFLWEDADNTEGVYTGTLTNMPNQTIYPTTEDFTYGFVAGHTNAEVLLDSSSLTLDCEVAEPTPTPDATQTPENITHSAVYTLSDGSIFTVIHSATTGDMMMTTAMMAVALIMVFTLVLNLVRER